MTLIALIAAPSALAAPTPSYTVSPNPPTFGVAATFTSTSTPTVGTTIATVEWDFDADPAFEKSGTEVQQTFATAGTHTFRMRVVDSGLPLLNETISTMTVEVGSPPTAAFTFNPASPLVNEAVLFASNSTDPDRDSLDHSWDFGDGSGPSTARNPSHQYSTPGTKTVRLTVDDGHGGVDDVTETVVVRDPSAAKAAFTFTPDTPMAGQTVTFTSTSTPSAGQNITSQNWDLDSDGQYDDGQGKTATRAFDSAGVYRVALRVMQANGNAAVAEGTVRVGSIVEAPPPGATPNGPTTPPGTKPKAKPTLLTPFPVVRIQGDAYADRTVINVLSVIQAPRGALVRVRCVGKVKGCPKVTRRKRSKGKRLRFKTFERSIYPGAKLQVFVLAKGRVGKYTGFKIRRGRSPARTDLCVVPGKTRPRPCPS